MANLRADHETSRLWTWGAGMSAEYYFSRHMAIRAEPMFLNKGGTIEGTREQPRITIDFTYFEVPLLFKYDLSKPEDAYILAGPSIGYTASADLGVEISNHIFKADFKDLTEKLDISALLGVGINIPVPYGKMFLECTYTHGFTNVPKTGTFTAEWNGVEIEGEMNEKDTEFRTYGIRFMLGYLIEI